jgi:hypothetical protein
MTTTANEFIRRFRAMCVIAARGKTVRVAAPEGTYTFQLEETQKTCGGVLGSLDPYRGRGFFTCNDLTVTLTDSPRSTIG